MSKRFSKSIISGATLAGLAAVLLSAAGPAEAKPNSFTESESRDLRTSRR